MTLYVLSYHGHEVFADRISKCVAELALPNDLASAREALVGTAPIFQVWRISEARLIICSSGSLVIHVSVTVPTILEGHERQPVGTEFILNNMNLPNSDLIGGLRLAIMLIKETTRSAHDNRYGKPMFRLSMSCRKCGSSGIQGTSS